MIQKYTYGTPFETDAIVTSIPTSELCKMQINSLYNQSSHFIQTILITLKSLPVGKS